MLDSTTNATDSLLIDIEQGTLLQIPPTPTASRRYLESHPFAEIVGDYVIAGPDAQRVAKGSGGEDFVTYKIEGEYAGFLRLSREA